MCSPLLKWPGGKRGELSRIHPLIPDHERYFEPFFGGGGVYFGCINSGVRSYANDLHCDLMGFYKAVKDKDKDFFSTLYEWIDRWEKADLDERGVMYYVARDNYNASQQSTNERIINFFLIRQLAYGGMFRLNSSGDFNVPFGWAYAHSMTLLRNKADHLRSHIVREKMDALNLYAGDFGNFLDAFQFDEKDFMFVDPPYDTSFSAYEGADFGEAEQIRLADRLRSFPGKFMLVCKLTPMTEKLYCDKKAKGLYVMKYDHQYRFNIKGRFSRDTKHIMVTNYETHW